MRQNIVKAAKSKDPESSSDAPTPDLGFRTRAPALQFGLRIPRTQQEDPRDGKKNPDLRLYEDFLKGEQIDERQKNAIRRKKARRIGRQ